MGNIIDQIIEIDMIAQKKLNEAEALREACRIEIEDALARDTAELEQSAASRMQKVEAYEAEALAGQKAAVDAKISRQTEGLIQAYEKGHLALEEALFQNVLGLSSEKE